MATLKNNAMKALLTNGRSFRSLFAVVVLMVVLLAMGTGFVSARASSLSGKRHRNSYNEEGLMVLSTPTTASQNYLDMTDSGAALVLSTTQVSNSSSEKKQTYVSNYLQFIGRNCTNSTTEKDCGGLEALICSSNNTCSFCTDSSQCSSQIHQLYSCHLIGKVSPQGGVCEHKDLFEYVSYLDILATVTCFIGGVLSAASGTGGGGVFVPLLHVAGQFPPTLAIPISTLMIFGAGLINIATLSFKRHPHADRPLIDYDIALM